MTFEAFFELAGFTAIILALRYYFQGRILAAIPASRLALGILLCASMIKYLINGVEWSGIFAAFAGLDPLEDYLDDIWPLLWFFLFFSILMDFAGKETRESRKRYQMLFDGSKDAICIMDGNAAILECNESAAALTGYERESLVRMSMKDIDATHDPDMYQSHFNKPVNAVSFIKETVVRRKDGACVPVELSNRLVIINHQKVMHTVARDISDRKQAQQLLESEKERLDITLHGIGHGVITTDMQGTIILMNKVAEDLTGWSQNRAWGRKFSEVVKLLDEFTGIPVDDAAARIIEKKGTMSLPENLILVGIDGASYPVSGSATLVVDRLTREIGAVIVVRDITQERRYHADLLKTEKLESLGVLAGGIAHDFNNYLTGILGNLSMVKESPRLTDALSEALTNAENLVFAAKGLAQQILTFSKGGSPVKEKVDIGDLLKEYTKFASRGASVRCDFDLPHDLKCIDADKNQMGQVISNMVINACQAMPEGGVIRIRAKNTGLMPGNDLGLASGHYVKISIKDSGTGIHPNRLGKIFDPYYTTKAKGSGLGLAVCFSVVKQHDGKILVDSDPGIGTTFSIYLPAAAKEHASPLPGPLPSKPAGRILVMDDEDYIRNITSKMLEHMGFRVTAVADGEAAVEAYQTAMERGAPFDAVILDLTIPGGMGGKDTIRRLREMDKDVYAIVASGYSNDAVMSNFSRYGFKAALKKPYTLADMRAALNMASNAVAAMNN